LFDLNYDIIVKLYEELKENFEALFTIDGGSLIRLAYFLGKDDKYPYLKDL